MGAGAEVLPLRTGLTGKGSRVASLHQERGGGGRGGGRVVRVSYHSYGAHSSQVSPDLDPWS